MGRRPRSVGGRRRSAGAWVAFGAYGLLALPPHRSRRLRFCGRSVCENHVKTRPFILQLFQRDGATKALVVDDALHCGACAVRPNPVELPELD